MSIAKKVLMITLLLSMVFTFSVSAQEFSDVPRDHWAYDSVHKLAERGYLSLYAGEDFNGDQAVTRYEMAEVIANLLDNMTTNNQDLSEDDVDTIRELSLEFRDELVDVVQRQKKFEDRLKEVEDQNQIQDEDISDVNVRVAELQEEVQSLSDHIDNLAQLNSDVTNINQRLSSLESQLEQLKTEGLSGQKMQELEDNQSINMTKIQELENRIKELEAEKSAKNDQIESEKNSIKPGYVIGALAILALIL
ncbi:S-layer homology domain-containing protein [Halanaerobium salsuginis]|jgi:uncharacterized coiled-coil protein SlyX|uniref:S-layer homology domain-containing protein n=1 Tax=Halanaerobium salsuginis TaxID=29563 RepID=A0A1I4F508_9FIRM|nr:S-layer homology domain-containing protein [Halanaerobium salsuginis]SFL12639.1 S-layer homology domain-containing protein [Halanaerobium salsuginis]